MPRGFDIEPLLDGLLELLARIRVLLLGERLDAREEADLAHRRTAGERQTLELVYQ